jgi:hypothetical protein
MNKERTLRLSSLALIVGSVAFFPWLIAMILEEFGFLRSNTFDSAVGELIVIVGFVAGPLLLSIGLVGMYGRFRERLGISDKFLLLFGAVGGITSFIGGMGQRLGGESDTFFAVFMYGFLVLFGCLVLYGVLTLRSKSLPRWYGLPLIAGATFITSILSSAVALIFLGILVQSNKDKVAAT